MTTPSVKQFLPQFDSPYGGKYFIVKSTGTYYRYEGQDYEIFAYMNKRGQWQATMNQLDGSFAYFDTKEEAEAVLKEATKSPIGINTTEDTPTKLNWIRERK